MFDVDGVLAASELLYTSEGKTMKIFGPDDHDALNLLRDKIPIHFVSGDKRGFPISERRVNEIKFDLHLVSTFERLNWIKETCGDPKEVLYVGDGIFDAKIFEGVGYSIAPSDAFYLTKEKASFVTHSPGGRRCVAEACVHILEKFLNITDIVPNEKYGIWAKKGQQEKK